MTLTPDQVQALWWLLRSAVWDVLRAQGMGRLVGKMR